MSPFGLKHKGYNNVITGRNHQYGYGYEGEKEEQNELGLNWIDYGARNYDASLGRWFSVDNMAEEFYDMTPYKYGMNNPIYYTDPDGNCEKCWARLWGGLQVIGGAIEVIGGAVGVVAPEPATTVGGILLVGNGVDNVQAGLRTLWTGESTDTVLHQGVEAGAEALGASPETANKIATVTEVATGLGGIVKGGYNLLKNADEALDAGSKMIDDLSGSSVNSKTSKSVTGGQNSRSSSGNFTEPTLPSKTIVDQNGVKIQHYYKSGDHAPAHMHVNGKGVSTKIGPNGKSIKGSPQPSTYQKAVIDANKSRIRSSGRKINNYIKFQNYLKNQ